MAKREYPNIRSESALSPNQRRCVQHCLDGPGSIVAADIGTGKTVILLTVIAEALRRYRDIRRVLVLGPKNVVRLVWPEEIRGWEHTRHLAYGVIASEPAKRRRAVLDAAPQITLCSYEGLVGARRPNREPQGLLDWFGFVDKRHGPPEWEDEPFPFDLLICDEIDKLKDPGTRRMRQLQRFLRFFKMRIGATGTLTPNGLLEIWGPVRIVTNGEIFGTSYTAFKQKYFYSPDYMRTTWLPLPGKDREIERAIAPITYRIDIQDEAHVPPLHVVDVPIEMPADAKRHYGDMERKLIAELPDIDDPVIARSAAAKAQKLAQMAAGFVYDGPPEERVTIPLHAEKYAALGNILSELQGAQVIVFYMFEAQRAELLRRYPEIWRLDSSTYERWNRGEGSVLMLHPQEGAHGLNLHKGGCHHIVFLTCPWSGGLYQQAVGRVKRRGQTRKTIVHRIQGVGTIDARIASVLTGKIQGDRALLDAMRAVTMSRVV